MLLDVRVMGGACRSISLASPEEGGGLVVGVEEAGGASSTIHCDRLLLATGSSPEGHRYGAVRVLGQGRERVD